MDVFSRAGASGVHIVSDFDLTLTTGKERGKNMATWDVLDGLMPPSGVEAHRAIYESFRPYEIAGTLDEEMATKSWSDLFDLITSYSFSQEDIEAAFLSLVDLRPGAKELFDLCLSHEIPTVVLSAGIKDVIEVMTNYHDLRPTHILSNELIYDEKGKVYDWRRDKLVHIANKHVMVGDRILGMRETHPNIILLGDAIDDVKMASGDERVIRIRVVEPREGETYDREQALDTSFKAGYDLVTEYSLSPVIGMIDQIINNYDLSMSQ